MPVVRYLMLLCLLALPAWAAAQASAKAGPPSVAAPGAVPPLQDIAAVAADHNGDTIPDAIGTRVRVRGTVLTASGLLRSHGLDILIADGSGGLQLYNPDFSVSLAPGDRIEVIGRVSQYKGAVQLDDAQITRLGHGPLPHARRLTGAEAAGWRHMGRRVMLAGHVDAIELDDYGVLRLTADDGAHVSVFVPPSLVRSVPWKDFAGGVRVDVTGVLSIYKPAWPYNNGFEIVLTRADDLLALSKAAPAWQAWVARVAVLTVAVLAMLLLVFHLLQRRQRARELELKTLGALSNALASTGLDEEQLARHACEVLITFGIVDAVLVQVLTERGCLRQLATVAADPRVGNVLAQTECVAGPGEHASGDSHQRHIQARVSAQGLQLLAVHPLLVLGKTHGFLVALSPRRRRPSALQERTLMAAVKLLAMALENQQIKERAEQEQRQMQQLVITDELTRLYNRRFLDEYLRIQIPLARRRGGGLAFLCIDIDHFKQVNDTYGHEAGDRILAGVAAIVRDASRSGDLPVRLGGEEFLLIMVENDVDGAMLFAERLRAAIEQQAFHDTASDRGVQVTISVGVAMFGMHGDEAGALLRASDEAMYASKRAGRNRVTLAAVPEGHPGSKGKAAG